MVGSAVTVLLSESPCSVGALVGTFPMYLYWAWTRYWWK